MTTNPVALAVAAHESWQVFDRNEGRTEAIRKRLMPTFPSLRTDCRCDAGKVHLYKRQEEWSLREFVETVGCPECQGRSWVPVTDYDTLREAIGESGWRIHIHGYPDHDDVVIFEGTYGHAKCLSEVNLDEELRGTHAILVCMLRALVSLPDNGLVWLAQAEAGLAQQKKARLMNDHLLV